MGFESRGQGLGSTFFFELPIYSAATAGVDLTSAPPQLFSPWRENRIIPAGDSVPVTLVSAVESESATLGTNIPGELGGFFVGQVSTRSEIQPQSTRSYLSDFLEVVSLGLFRLFSYRKSSLLFILDNMQRLPQEFIRRIKNILSCVVVVIAPITLLFLQLIADTAQRGS